MRCWPSRACTCRSPTCSGFVAGYCWLKPRWIPLIGLVSTACAGCWRHWTSRSTWLRICCRPSWPATAATRRLEAIPGIGPTLAAVFVAEIGDVGRFTSARHLTSWAGLTPRHRESDTTVHRGPITKQGSTLVRWAAIEAAQKTPAWAGWLHRARAGITQRRGRNTATVAVARKLLILVYYGLRDGHIRALAHQAPDVA